MTPQQYLVGLDASIADHLAAAPRALHTSGPRTLEGKQRVALNGVTHGLSGQNVFITQDEYPAYFELGADYIAELRPVGVRETQLAQKIIDCNWRLNRLAAIENNLLNGMMAEISRNVQPSDPKSEVMLSQAEAFQIDCDGPNAFDKLGRYETRLTRMLFKMTEELERLQKIRLARGADTFVQSECKAWLWYNRLREVNALQIKAAEAASTASAQAEPVSAEDAEPLRSTAAGSVLPFSAAQRPGELLRKKADSSPAASESDLNSDHPKQRCG